MSSEMARELGRLMAIAADLEPADLADVIDLAEARRRGEAPDLSTHDVAWLESDGSGLEGLEPFDWGPGGEPKGTPVQWDTTRGEFVLRESK